MGRSTPKLKRSKPRASASSKAPVASNSNDELTFIKNIGPVLEKKLNGVGISRFEHIAGWSEKDINAFSGELNFKGRIEREEWVQQARELANAPR